MGLWDSIGEVLKERIGEQNFHLWFEPLDDPEINNGRGVVYFTSDYYRDHVAQFLPDLEASIKSACPEVTQVEFRIRERLAESGQDFSRPASVPAAPAAAPAQLLFPQYTFDTFVVGENNQFAHAFAQAVAKSPGQSYNPLLIYGGTGLGKTHLMFAIGHYVLEHQPGCKVVYVSSEQFCNELAESIAQKKQEEFRTRYRTADVLLLDDIQFLGIRGEHAQDEIFNVFNRFIELKKQLVLSSDKPVKEIPKLEERVRSRFASGMITDIQLPDLETRIAILKKKAEQSGAYVPDDILHFIANNIKTNIRTLEGGLNRVVGYATHLKRELDIALVKEVLKDILDNKWAVKKFTVGAIQKGVADHFHLKLGDMRSGKKAKSVSYPRQIAMYLARELTELSLVEIGIEFGGKDHSTIIHGHRKISAELERDEQLQKTIAAIKESL